jgi:hypothetical protein
MTAPQYPITQDEAGPEGLGLLAPTVEPTLAVELAQEAEEEQTLPGHLVHVVLADGRDLQVRIDNRDFVHWDMTAPRQKWGTASTAPFLFQTFIAWSALKREDLYSGGFTTFQRECLEAADVKGDDDDTARPTR